MLSNLELEELAKTAIDKFEEKAKATACTEEKQSYLRCAESAKSLALKVSRTPQISLDEFNALPERRQLEIERVFRSKGAL